MKEVFVFLVFVLLISGCSPEKAEITVGDVNETTVNETVDEVNESVQNETVEEEPVQTCKDTDGGKDYEIKGTVILEGKRYRTVKDYCDNPGLLVEYYCKGDGALGTDLHYCSESGDVCLDGTCGELNTTETNDTNSS